MPPTPPAPPVTNHSSNATAPKGRTQFSKPISQSPPTSEPNFVCTICWQSQYLPSKPKLLGTSSRIVCRSCWCAVLDLSICWVCGECIVRGDEVVSLGWCFWHRGCFGCLVCGTRISLAPFEEESAGGKWGKWDGGSDDRGEGRKRSIGVELDSIPLCGACEVETEGQSQGKVLERGLETVSRFDGGLSRNRLERLSVEREETTKNRRSRFKGSSGLERQLRRFINGSASRWSEFIQGDDDYGEQTPLVKDAGRMGMSEDGNMDDEHHHSDTELTDLEQTEEETRPEIYVSVLNPVGEPAFKPSKTKPLPKWMALLPSSINREREVPQKASYFESLSHSHELEILEGRTSPQDDNWLPEEKLQYTPISCSNDSTPQSLSRSSTLRTAPIDIADKSLAPMKGRITIAGHPNAALGEPSGGIDHRNDRQSKTNESIYQTPPEYSSRFPPRQQTPYPHQRRPSLHRNETTSYFSHAQPADSTHVTLHDSSCELEAHLQSSELPLEASATSVGFSTLSSKRPSPFVLQSSEYLERYQPESPNNEYKRYVANKPEPIIAKIKRQKVGRQNMEQVAEETAEKGIDIGGSPQVRSEEYGLDPRREELKKELINLFS